MKLSIVTPTLNSAQTFRATLESVRCVRSLVDAEHIVVDSGSTDETESLAKESGAIWLYHPPGNMYAAINAGLAQATGEWLTYINSDDLLYADAVAEMLDSCPNGIDLLYGNLDYIDESGRFLFYWRSASERRLKLNLSQYCAVLQQGVLFHRRVLERLGGFDETFRFCGDYDFFLRAACEGFRFRKYRKKSVGAFRLRTSQLSQSRKSEMSTEGPQIRARYWEGKPKFARTLCKMVSFFDRNLRNLDSRMIRALHARGLDKRDY